MEKLSRYLKFLLFIALSFVIVYALNFTITSAYTVILNKFSKSFLIASIGVVLLFMVLGTLIFGSVAFKVRKLNTLGRIGALFILPGLLLYSLWKVRTIYIGLHIEYGYDPEHIAYKTVLYSMCFLIVFMTYKIGTILATK